MPDSAPVSRFAVLVPVKPPAVGKSRLRGLGLDHRRALAEAFALDTVAACRSAERVGAVLVVTDDVAFSARLSDLGATAIPDGVTGDLNGTLRQAAAEAHRRWPHLTPVAVCADLPALRADELDQVLARTADGRPWFVADADGVGTTLYTAPYDSFAPRFGPGSRAAHLASGAGEVVGAAESVRRDVDDLHGLRDAIALGVGRHTAAVAP